MSLEFQDAAINIKIKAVAFDEAVKVVDRDHQAKIIRPTMLPCLPTYTRSSLPYLLMSFA
jgi:hypothetical protein